MTNKRIPLPQVTMNGVKGAHRLQYKNIYLDDNLEGNTSFPEYYGLYNGQPLKFMMTLIGISIDGEITMRLNLQEYHVRANEVIVIPKGTVLDMIHHEDNPHFAFLSLTENDHLFINTRFQEMSQKDLPRQPRVVKVKTETLDCIIDTYRLMRHTISAANDHCDAILEGYVMALWNWIADEIEYGDNRQQMKKLSRKEVIFNQFLQNLRLHYTKERSVAFYARLACVSPKYFGIVIKQVSERRAIDWIDDMVILDAKALILNGSYTIAQIADMLHFPNPSFFSRYFKDHVGCSPGQYGK